MLTRQSMVLGTGSVLLVALLLWLGLRFGASTPSIPKASADSTPPLPNMPLGNQPTDAVLPVAVDPSFPVPAKKLHKLLHDPALALKVDGELAQKTEDLNQRLAQLNAQLAAKGLVMDEALSVKTQEDKTRHDMAERLETLRRHLSAQQKP